jgi:glycosyltransferase involved in cell wall biosynthesis
VSLSIVTPTLNAEAYVARCLASIHSQLGPGMEHVVVDGGSTDRTAEIAEQYPRAVVIRVPGINQSAAINLGLRRATGEIVAWLNADDEYVSGALHLVARRFEASPAMDVLFGDCEVVGPEGQRFWYERPGAYDFRRLLRRGNYVAQPAVFMRKRVLDDVGYLDETLNYAMDYELWLRLRDYRVEYLPRPLARFRWHNTSKTAQRQMQAWTEVLLIARRYGGGWTPALAWAFGRCLLTLARTRVASIFTGSVPMRPLTRGYDHLKRV